MIENIILENTYLRKFEIGDAQDMFEYTSNPNVSNYLAWTPHESVQEDEMFIAMVEGTDEKESIYRGIYLKETKKLIGCIHIYNISWKHMHAEISYILNPTYSSKGYATEAVRSVIEELFKHGFIRIQALCIVGNGKSENLMKRVGMNYEGTLRKYAVLADKKAYDMRIYAICVE